MAMALLDASIPADRFRIDAVDISTRALTQAERAVYGRNSFRGHELEFRDRHFEATAHGYRLSETVRRQVRFQQGNLFAAGLLPGGAVRRHLLPKRADLLRSRHPGPRHRRAEAAAEAEGCVVRRPGGDRPALEPRLRLDERAVGLRVSSKGRHSATSRTRIPGALKRTSIRQPAAPPTLPPRPARATAAAPAAAPRTAVRDREVGRHRRGRMRLADQGHFVEAATCCEEHLRRHGPSAAAFHLMGLVRDATGNQPEAVGYYRKALYLEPESLRHANPPCVADGEAGRHRGREGAAKPRAPAGTATQDLP